MSIASLLGMPISSCLPFGKKNVIHFKDAPLSEVIKVLNRWYDVDFKIEDQSARDVYYDYIREYASRKVLQDLRKIAPLRFEYKEAEKEVIVTRKKKEDSRLMH